MKDYLINELLETVTEIEMKFKKVERIKEQLLEAEQFEQMEVIGIKEVAEIFGMSKEWAGNLIRDIKKRCDVLGAGNKIPKALLLRETGHIERRTK